jgi:hypothetical protein
MEKYIYTNPTRSKRFATEVAANNGVFSPSSPRYLTRILAPILNPIPNKGALGIHFRI